MLGLIASILAIAITVLMTYKIWWAPVFSVFGQIYWIWYEIRIGEYGLILCTVVIGLVHLAAIPRWYRERGENKNVS